MTSGENIALVLAVLAFWIGVATLVFAFATGSDNDLLATSATVTVPFQ